MKNTHMDVLKERVAQSCLASRLAKQGCTLDLDDAPQPHMVVDLDHADAPVGRRQRKCDYLFFGSEGKAGVVAAAIEMKSSGVKPSGAKRQLQAGARITEPLVVGLAPVRFVPVVAHGADLARRTYDQMAKQQVSFRKGTYQIELIPCGSPLEAALE